MTKTTTKKKSVNTQELKTLAKQITEQDRNVHKCVVDAQEKGKQALNSAVAAGERLLRVKALILFGSFSRWIKDNCKSMSIRTAQRYMTLATHGAQLVQTDVGLRQAYGLLGIIKEDETAATPDAQQPNGASHPIIMVAPGALVSTAVKKAHSVASVKPTIQKDDLLSRAKFLVKELTTDLAGKLNNESIIKSEASQILKPLFDLVS